MNSHLHPISATDRILIRYEIRHQQQILEATEGDETIEYHMGEGHWPDQIESEILGKPVGATLEVNLLASDNAFGPIDPGRILTMQARDFAHVPEPGALVQFTLPDGEETEGQVLRVFGEQLEVDFNHPYAGRDLSFKIQINRVVN